MQNVIHLRAFSLMVPVLLLIDLTVVRAQEVDERATSTSEAVDIQDDADDGRPLTAEGEQVVSEEASDADGRNNGVAVDADEDDLDAVLAGHSFHGEEFDEGPRQSARLMGGTGNVRFPASTHMPLVQQFINQGVGQLHGFWFFEAERSFRQAAALDPDCAIAYWGMAMANINNAERAKNFIEEAVEHKATATPRERMWIEALHDRYHKESDDDKAKWQAYVTAIENIVHEYPEDIEAKVFLALHLFWGDSGKALGVPSREAVDSLLEQVFTVNPMHPAHHYRIHLWDHQKPERALHSAARVGQAAPSIAHMWHMSGHIFSRLKRYEDACWQQEASSRVDHAYMIDDQVLPTEIHNYTHNQEWFIRNLIKVGRIRDAVRLAQNLVELPRHPRHNAVTSDSSAVVRGRTRLLDVLIAFELWDELVDLAETPYLAVDDAQDARVRKLRYLGVAHAALGQREMCDAKLAELEELLETESSKGESQSSETEDEAANGSETRGQLEVQNAAEKTAGADQPVRAEGAVDVASTSGSQAAESDKDREERKKDQQELIDSIESAIAHVRGQQALAAGNAAEAVTLLKQADDVPQTALSSALVKAKIPDEAVSLAAEAVADAENECYPLACYVKTLHECGKPDQARQELERLRDLSASIDVDMSVFAKLEPIAIEFGYGSHWLRQPAERDDVGERPPLESLGPLLWRASAAPSWSLTRPDGNTVSLSDFHGRPVVVIFYLGFGCLHCVEQLGTFSPLADSFREAGIEIVAIGSEELSLMQRALATYTATKELHIPLASDAELNVFKQYGCFDDFEGMALHGTFLIDSTGQVRWSDIGYEPFQDAEFLLAESVRLLSLSAESATDQN